MDKIPIYQPYLDHNEKNLVMDCMETTWISSKGSYIKKFENLVKDYTKANYCSAISNGTNALHLALLALVVFQKHTHQIYLDHALRQKL